VPASPTGQHSRTAPLFWPLAVAAGLLYGAIAGFNIAYGAMNVDEGFYAAAARAVWQGEVPYRDFGYTQAPLLPYVNGAVMKVVGFGLFEQRTLNAVWSLLAIVLGMALLRRRGFVGRAVLLLLLFALTPAWMYLTSLGKTYGFVSLVAMSAVWVLLEWPAGWRKSAILAGLVVLGVGCRLPAGPFFAVIWLAGLRDADGFSLRRAGAACGWLAGAVGAFLAPFHLLAPEQTRFWLIDFHRVSVPLRDWHVRWEEIVALAPGIWAALALTIVAGLAARRRWSWGPAAIAAAALVALAFNLLPEGAYEEYGVPFLPPLAVAALLLLPGLDAWPRGRIVLAVALVMLPVVLIPLLHARYPDPAKQTFPSNYLPANTRPYNYRLAANLRAAADRVRTELAPGEPFYGPAIILAVEADRPIPRRLRMGAFTMTADFPTERADRLHLMTYPELAQLAAAAPMRVIGMHAQSVFNYSWSVPSFAYQSPAERARWVATFTRRFEVGYTDEDFFLLVPRR
jgi:4-amino-4-deoxy-L-arabinose transferase-like glycosyltransferase